jgi:hypothetical protein
MDRNAYSDIILKVLLNDCKVKNRCIILSTFDPSLAIILSLKQNKFPVLFLTNGITKEWTPYLDLRSKGTQISTTFAKAEKLMVIVSWIYPVSLIF